jgi:hypothetical protein
MKRNALAAVVAVLFAATAHANVARVDFAAGDVSAVAPDGKRRPLVKGSEVQVGETVSIQQGRAQLRFADGAYMSLQPGTEFKIEEFRFTGKQDGTESIVMHLLKGGMRTITGLIGRANRQNYKLRTEVATIGIRGTEFSVRYTDSIEVFCAEGAIFVQNEGGTVPLSSGEGARVVNVQTPATKTDEPPVLSPRGSPTTEPKVDEPVNPVQEARAVLAAAPVTFAGSWAAAQLTKVDSAVGSSITLVSANALQAFGGNVPNGSSSTVVVVDGSDGISWGRWSDGVVGGTGVFLNADTRTAPLHWVAGLPTPNMPTGQALFMMIGSTPLSCVPTCAATLPSSSSSSLRADFTNRIVQLNIDVMVNAIDLYSTAGNPISLTISGSGFSGSGSTSGSGASLSAGGFFSGDAAARAGLAFHLLTPNNQNVNGAIAYKNSGPGI